MAGYGNEVLPLLGSPSLVLRTSARGSCVASSKRIVAYLANRAGVPVDFALDLLQEAGLKVRRSRDHVPAPRMAVAERALDLARPLPRPQPPLELPLTKVPTEHSQDARDVALLTREERRDAGVEVVGRRERLAYLTFVDVERIHWKLVEDFRSTRDPIDPAGIKSEDLLHSALSRPTTSMGRDLKYPTATMAAAALLHSLIHNHPFHNGNKRTALVSMLVFLDKNHWSLRVESDDELFEFLLSVGSHSIVATPDGRTPSADAEVTVIAKWLHRRLRPTGATTRAFKFHDLRTLLAKYGCEFEPKSGNRINIRRGPLSMQVWYGGEGRDVRPGTIPKIRRQLHLDEEHGYDSEVFYNAEARLPGFIMRYRNVLDRLAKT